MWYLASPFFNPAQVKLVEDLERAFEENRVEYFSPRKADQNKKPGPLSGDDADKIFESNVEGLFASDFMLAVVDWKMPDAHQIRPVKVSQVGMNSNMGERIDATGGPLNIPDTGVSWELGFASAMNVLGELGSKWVGQAEVLKRVDPFEPMVPKKVVPKTEIPILLYTERPPDKALNLMLTRRRAKVRGVVRSVPDLHYFLNRGDHRWNLIVPYNGANQ